ncbi:class I SAM-dependent methyltransferase [Luteimonas aestuarii]|uniref:Class I SAM-dependent methyltransferase n=1 Tax=Luteimonas aestuarii TaxID=453837 RepID=A0A4R5TY02_9GAMM|nr:class I SAM-dependent methyltransferase [Luteimonas aestuarii]TDK26099.1 class I SAM-dependent methyltransferase [Luteimonas aestuarii]
MSETIDRINLRTMTTPAVVAHYARPWSLSAAEQAAFDRVAPLAHGKPILDIGVGGGRTVDALRDISRDYLGIDYSQEMVDACRQRYPDARFAFADARAMGAVADDSIFLAVFSCNGIGMVSHADRLSILREVQRVLQPGGLFVFSTHNRDSAEFSRGFRLPDFQWTANPARLVVRAARYASETWQRLRNRSRHRPHEVHTEDYAVINDVCHHYGTMLYYVTLDKQREQLADAGFERDAEAYDLQGTRLEGDTRDDSILLVARKRSVSQAMPPALAPCTATA